jgi:hypothetical protein
MNVWNAFLAKGYKVLLQAGLAILSLSQSELLKRCDSEENILIFFSQKTYLSKITPKKMATEMEKFKIPYRILTQMETFWGNNKLSKNPSKLTLATDKYTGELILAVPAQISDPPHLTRADNSVPYGLISSPRGRLGELQLRNTQKGLLLHDISMTDSNLGRGS